MQTSSIEPDRNEVNDLKDRLTIIYNPQFWLILFIFILITVHHYDDQTGFTIFSMPDLPLGITRHTIDRMLYLVPIILSSFFFGLRGGIVTLISAFVFMLPRALLISPNTKIAVLETLVSLLIGSFAPLWAERHRRQGEQLEAAVERLESTQRKLYSKVRLSMEQEKQLAVINSFSAMLTQSLEIEQVLKTTIDMVMDVMQVEVVIVFSHYETSRRLRVVAFKGIQEKSAMKLDGVTLEEGFYEGLLKTGKEKTVDTVSSCLGSHLLGLQDERLETQLCMPLVARGRVLGVICIATRLNRLFREPDIKLLFALGNLIGVAMDNSRLFKEREFATEQLKLSVKRYRQLFENAHDAIWVQDLNGNIITANQAAADLFRCDLSELVGVDIKRFLPGSAISIHKKIQMDLLRGQEKQEPYMQRFIREDGSEAVIMLTTNLISSSGSPDGLQFIGRDMTKEVRMHDNQNFYLQQITRAHEDERLRISRDLHDSTAQNLIAILHQLENYCRANDNLPKDKLKFLWELHMQLKELLQDIRQLSRDLRPSILDDLGLLPAVEWLIEQLKTQSNVTGGLIISGTEKRFMPEIEVALFRIIQEALRNIAKHGNAAKAKVVIEFKNTETRVTISDDGEGFEIPTSLGELSRLGKLGIDGMQTRARLIGGTFNIRSGPGEGTTITIIIPEYPG